MALMNFLSQMFGSSGRPPLVPPDPTPSPKAHTSRLPDLGLIGSAQAATPPPTPSAGPPLPLTLEPLVQPNASFDDGAPTNFPETVAPSYPFPTPTPARKVEPAAPAPLPITTPTPTPASSPVAPVMSGLNDTLRGRGIPSLPASSQFPVPGQERGFGRFLSDAMAGAAAANPRMPGATAFAQGFTGAGKHRRDLQKEGRDYLDKRSDKEFDREMRLDAAKRADSHLKIASDASKRAETAAGYSNLLNAVKAQQALLYLGRTKPEDVLRIDKAVSDHMDSWVESQGGGGLVDPGAYQAERLRKSAELMKKMYPDSHAAKTDSPGASSGSGASKDSPIIIPEGPEGLDILKRLPPNTWVIAPGQTEARQTN